MKICKNCQTEVIQNYCPECGFPAILKRIDGKYIFQEIRNVLNFEKVILFTIRELTINPGKSMKFFLDEDRNRLVKPIVFLIVTSLIYTIFNNIFHFEDTLVNFSKIEESGTLSFYKWVQRNYGYANIIMAFFLVPWLKILFRKYQFNFFEILVVLCFVMGMGMLVFSVFGIFQGLTHVNSMQVAIIVGFVYTTYAIGQFFDKRKFMSYFKALIAYLMGMLTFTIALIAAGIIIFLITRN